MIALHNVRYVYPEGERAALDDVTLTVASGEFCAIVGPNGAGKSTLCYAITGFVPHTFGGTLSGDVIVAGRNTREHPLSDLVMHCGMVFYNPLNQLSGARFTVREELAFGLENLGVPRPEMIERIDAVLDLLHIRDLADRSPFALSGGQQQRVAIASILVMQPRVLVLDEPTAQLDPLGSRAIVATIRALRRTGVTVILVEQKPELLATADRVIVMHEGKVVLDGAPRAVLADERLLELGVEASRYTEAARRGMERNLWPSSQPLPVTLEQAVIGFDRATTERSTSE